MKTQSIEMQHGAMIVIDCGDVKVHAYQTKDLIDDEVIVLEKAGKGIVVEIPPFKENIAELEQYIREKNIDIQAKLVSYHAAGSSFLPEVPSYATESANSYNTNGGGAALIGNFTKAFGDAFDSGIVLGKNILKAGKTQIAGIDMIVKPNAEAFEIEFPEIRAAYMHMLGHDCHSIVPGAAAAEAMAANLQDYLDRGFETFLSAHYVPETRKDAETKIAYLKETEKLASESKDAAEFTAKMKAEFPGYSGENYLGMTAGAFFS